MKPLAILCFTVGAFFLVCLLVLAGRYVKRHREAKNVSKLPFKLMILDDSWPPRYIDGTTWDGEK